MSKSRIRATTTPKNNLSGRLLLLSQGSFAPKVTYDRLKTIVDRRPLDRQKRALIDYQVAAQAEE
jgi:hypothetical protein